MRVMDSLHLKRAALLGPLESEDLQWISRMMEIVDFPGDTLVLREDEPGCCLYLILQGEVEIIKSLGTANERLISIQGPDEIFGEISLIVPDGKRTASVRTLGSVKLAKLSHASFSQILNQKPAVAMEIMRRLSIRLQDAELSIIQEMEKSHLELARAYDETLEGWAKAMELRDADTEKHNCRVGETTLKLAYNMGLRGDALVHIRRGAVLHDIGKIGVPDHILRKPGPLNKEEWAIMRKHPTFARDMLAPIDYLAPAIDIPYCHHEKWDGSGYPNQLKGREIPLTARIFSIVDAWDALTDESRPYHQAISHNEALQKLRPDAGSHFDPEVAACFFDMMG
jgi:HD-GYP domain-containing protein (c-di-GMP phosphodiesterase class II)